jgi:1-deoxy-D-xylulose-5-phosphate synthase
MLGRVTRMDGPRLLHVVTRKGKGYTPAEDEPCNYHGVPPFDPESGQRASAGSGAPTFTQVFSDAICELGEQNPDLVAITPAMREGSGLVAFEQRFPERFYDVGIAEQHAVTYAAGLACDGLRPVVAIYSTFLQRAYDQLIHDVALQGLPVTFAIDRAGVVGPDGPTHAGAFDLAFLRCIPELTVMVPSDEAEQRAMLATATALAGPAAVRYPRDRGSGTDTTDSLRPLPVGRGRQLRWGTGDSAILVFGPFTGPALAAAADQDASVADMRFVAPLDRDLLAELANRHTRLITVEDNTVRGGAGSAVREALGELGLAGQAEVVTLGLPDRFTDQGARGELLARYGLDADGLRHALAHGRPPVAGQPETP